MSKYICDHVDECSYHKRVGREYNSIEYNWHNIYKNGYYIGDSDGIKSPCKNETVYFIPYFEYLMKKTLKEDK